MPKTIPSKQYLENLEYYPLQFDDEITNYQNGLVEIYMVNEEPVGGIQFDIDSSFGDFEVTGTGTGGSAGDAGFTLSIGGQTILGFSLTLNPINPGEGVLLILNPDTAPTGLSGIVISDPAGEALDFVFESNDDNDIGFPLVSFKIISGAMLPTETAFIFFNLFSKLMKYELLLNSSK